MARPICVVCGRPRIPIDGWPRVHPECRSGQGWVWTPDQMRAWLAAREQNTPVPPPTAAVGARGDRQP